MKKFLIKATYTSAGTKGLIKEGGSSRKAAVEKMIQDLGGQVEAFYYALGEKDAYVIVDVPDRMTGVAVSLAVNASGAVALSTVPLLTMEEMDEACAKAVAYRPPGA
jgi:uncharacterized protein with GYD domain